MKHSWIAALALTIFPLCAAGQEHAPLPEQCKADYTLWKTTDTKESLSKLSAEELSRREVEMFECAASGTPGGDYIELSLLYGKGIAKRFEAYIRRHGEWHQFFAEDQAGVRAEQKEHATPETAPQTAGRLRDYCEDNPSVSSFYQGACDGFMLGWLQSWPRGARVQETGRLVTVDVEEGVTVGQVQRVFLAYIKQHPELESKRAHDVITEAWARPRPT